MWDNISMALRLNRLCFKITGVSLCIFLLGGFIHPVIGWAGLIITVIGLLVMFVTATLIDKEKSNERSNKI